MRVKAVKMKSDTEDSHARSASSSVQTRKKVRVTLAIDPGLSGTGLALFVNREPVRVEVLYTNRQLAGLDWWIRAGALAEAVGMWTTQYANPTRYPVSVVCEFPMKMESRAGLAAQKYGTHRLAFLVGALQMRLAQAHVQSFEPVLPISWKGQLPKSIVRDRIRGVLGKKETEILGVRSHAWDAVGIGLWKLGRTR